MADAPDRQARLMAQAVYEIRLLLAHCLGAEAECDPAVRQAAHLAYALHNEALAVVSGGTFDVPAVLERLAAIDELSGSQFHAGFTEVLGTEEQVAELPLRRLKAGAGPRLSPG